MVLSCVKFVAASDKPKGIPGRRVWHLLAVTLLASLTFCQPVHLAAQQTPFILPSVSATGLPEGASFEGLNESINLNNGGVLVVIPLLKLPGLAGLDFDLNLKIDSKTIATSNPYATGLQFAGGRIAIPSISSDIVYHDYYEDDPLHTGSGSNKQVQCNEHFVFRDLNGTQHGFNNRLACLPFTLSDTPIITLDNTIDGSLLRLDTSNPHDMVVSDKSGIQYHFDKDGGPVRILDLNGNKITIDNHQYVSSGLLTYICTITDTLNRNITITPDAITYKDSNGIQQQITALTVNDTPTVIHTSVTGQFDPFTGISFPANYPIDTSTYSGQPDVHVALSLPSGETFTVYYDALWEPTKVVYPSGGYTRYSYHNIPGLIPGSPWYIYGDIREIQQRGICSRSDGNCLSSEEAVTTYTADMLGYLDGNKTVDVRDPYGNRTHYDFSANPYWVARDSGASKETDRYIYSGESTLLRTIHTDYYTDSVSPTLIQSCSQPKKVTTTYNDIDTPIQSHIEYEYLAVTWTPQFNFPGCYADALSQSSNVTVKREYDFDGSLLRTTNTSWLSSSPSGTHLLDRMTGQSVTDASGFTSTKGWGYDGAGNLTSQTFGGTAMEDATTVLERDSYGRLITSTDPLNNITTYGYDSPWADSACAPASASPPSPSPSSVKDALNHTTSSLYNSCTGTVHSTADANSQTTTFQYDAVARQTHAAYPAEGGEITTTYDPSAGTTITKLRTLDATRSVTTKEVHDGVGRVVSQQNLGPEEGATTVESTYDKRGLVASTSNPFLSHSDANYGVTGYAYDALGRVQYVCNPDNGLVDCGPGASYRENSYSGPYLESYDELRKHTKKLADSLGRAIRVWEPDDTNAPVVETQYQYNGLDLLTSVVQLGKSSTVTDGKSSDASRSRSFQYGGRGQLIQSRNPESGTICYGSLGSGGCVSGYDANNRLTAKTDARGVVTNYSYDVLNRLTGKSYSGVIDSTHPPLSTCYAYDSDANSGTNTVDRLVSEWTQPNGCESTMPTSAASWTNDMSYNPMGRLVAESQCPVAPCSATNPANPISYTYDYVGSLTSSNNGLSTSALPGFVTTYKYDHASRISKISTTWDTPNHPSTLFNVEGVANAYGPFGLTAAQLGVSSQTQQASMTLNRVYDIRARVKEIDVYGATPASPTATTTTANISPAAFAFSDWAWASAHVDCNSACGYVNFKIGNLDWGTVPLDANGNFTTGTESAPHLDPGSYTFTASYLGDATHAPSVSQPFAFQILPPGTTDTTSNVTINPTVFHAGDAALASVHVDCDSACGWVLFKIDETGWGTLPLDSNGNAAPTTDSAPNMTPGSHHLYINYQGNATYKPSGGVAPFTVVSSGVALTHTTANISPAAFAFSDWAWASAHVDCNSACGYVTFKIGETEWGTVPLDANGNFTTGTDSAPHLDPGSYTLTVSYLGDATHAPSVSQPFAFQILPPGSINTTSNVTMSPTTFTAGTSALAAVHVDCNSACGWVQFKIDNTGWGSLLLDGYGNAAATTEYAPNMTPGTHHLYIHYQGNATYKPSDGDASFTVQ